MVRFAFYGKLADLMGRRCDFECAQQKISVGAAIALLCETDPAFKEALLRTTVKFAVNDVIVETEFIVAAGDEIAVLPPFSGG
ncbi:MAG TPA: molybdopterin synthase sulfur carrier subunit [Hyphomonadaceae bacterium]|nr:molybdopterin synthase sulfur carrier subunit [Hyphomonadaceae bacterium]